MPYDFQMLGEAFAADGDAFFEDQLGFALGEGVAFDGVGVVGEADVVEGFEFGNDAGGEGTEGVEPGFEAVNLGQFFGRGHGGWRGEGLADGGGAVPDAVGFEVGEEAIVGGGWGEGHGGWRRGGRRCFSLALRLGLGAWGLRSLDRRAVITLKDSGIGITLAI